MVHKYITGGNSMILDIAGHSLKPILTTKKSIYNSGFCWKEIAISITVMRQNEGNRVSLLKPPEFTISLW